MLQPVESRVYSQDKYLVHQFFDRKRARPAMDRSALGSPTRTFEDGLLLLLCHATDRKAHGSRNLASTRQDAAQSEGLLELYLKNGNLKKLPSKLNSDARAARIRTSPPIPQGTLDGSEPPVALKRATDIRGWKQCWCRSAPATARAS